MNYQTAFEMLREMILAENQKAYRLCQREHPNPYGYVYPDMEYQRGRCNATNDIYNESNRLLRHIGDAQ
ncbi:hypothetical protein COM45_04840 [Corynebacterium accolens]|uniref:Uncharacterized protein n=1 Tax=Corynebacterium accolens TaxID=38284 RepID=A0A2A4AH78_9CORY|nr:hypothetical protein COM45_04840 [Corynebacterium accolens]